MRTDGSWLNNYDKCLTWLKTDGSTCQSPSIFGRLHTFISKFFPNAVAASICCKDGTGCFGTSRNSPHECYLTVPQCMDKIRPEFNYYTPDRSGVHKINYEDLARSASQLPDSTTKRPFFVIVHGFGSVWPIKWMVTLKEKLLELGNNVMIVRWTNGSKMPFYAQAAANTRTVGAALAKVMRAMEGAKKISMQSSTIVGFSLGSQVAGYAGSNLRNLYRIIGLDPAGPLFQCMHKDARLDETDATFVQAIHTNGDYFLKGGAGTLQRLGHMDVYLNGGTKQPGCSNGLQQNASISGSFDFSGLADRISCSHSRATQYFIEMLSNAKYSQNTCKYLAVPCESKQKWLDGLCSIDCSKRQCPVAGYLAESTRRGAFYVNTLKANSGQFCGRQFLVKMRADRKITGKITITFRDTTWQYHTAMFQDYGSVLHNEKGNVLVVPWRMKSISSVQIMYTDYVNANSAPVFMLYWISITNTDGKTVINNNRIYVERRRRTLITFRQPLA